VNDTHAFPLSSSETRILRGKSIATEGAAIINGVPALGLPKMSNLVGLIFSPTPAASPLKSIRAKMVRPRDSTNDSRRSKVSKKEYLLAKRTIPLLLADNNAHAASDKFEY